jgi:hypothetical protein
MAFKTSITKDGPFFHGDPAKTFRDNAHDLMLAVAREGAVDVRGQMRATEAGRRPIAQIGDRVADHVEGELRKAPSGSKYSAVVFVRNRGFTKNEAISLMAAASQVESQIHAFRKTSGRISRAKGVNMDELLKGIA